MRTEKEIIEKLQELPDHNWDTPMEALQWVLEGDLPDLEKEVERLKSELKELQEAYDDLEHRTWGHY